MDSRIERTPRRPIVPPKPKTAEQYRQQKGTKSKGECDPVDVYCRIRPLTDGSESCVSIVNSTTIQISQPFNNAGYIKEQLYKFKRVFGERSNQIVHDTSGDDSKSDQKEVFDVIAKPLVSDLLKGKNGLLFAYGVTSSGKTYTMKGIITFALDTVFKSINEFQKSVFKPDHLNGFEILSEAEIAKLDRKRSSGNNNNNNIITRANNYIFRTPRNNLSSGSSNDSYKKDLVDVTPIKGLEEDNVYSVFVTYLEVYNNYIYDLLEDIPENNMTRNLQIKIMREDGNHNMYVHGCNEVEVKTTKEAQDLLSKGQKRRKVAHTSLNAESSRSHSIFTIRVVQCPLDENGENPLSSAGLQVSQLSLVDLAGAERTSRTKANGQRVKEAGNINNTLMMLRSCIEVLRDNQLNNANRMVPYRGSKITHYFKNYFDGDGKVKMVICVNPRASDYEETLSVLKFAEVASEVQVQRSEVRPATVALPRGRRQARQVFREVQRNMIQENEKAKELELDIKPIYTLCPEWPSLTLSDEDWIETINRLKSFLRKRLENRETMLSQAKTKSASARERVSALETDNRILREEKSSLEALYEDSVNRARHYEQQLLQAEAVNKSLYTDYKDLAEDYSVAAEKLEMAQNQGVLEKQRLKAKLNTQVEVMKMKQAEELKKKLLDYKSKMVKTQLSALKQFAGESSTASSDDGSSIHKAYTRQATKLQMTPAGLSGPAVSNPRHRRSFSQGAINIVDHRPLKTIDTNTVHKPVLGKRRSITRLKNADILKTASHYCLTTQNQDSLGELETKLYKGDVLPTTGGGSQVVFQDVEILKQRDPLAVVNSNVNTPVGIKRGSDGDPRRHLDNMLQHERWRKLENSPVPPSPRKRSKH